MSDTRRQRQAVAVLVLVTLFWGISFPWVRRWMQAGANCPGGDGLSALTLLALRMLLAMMLLAVWHRRGFTAATTREHLYGSLVGVLFGVGSVLQVMGLASTTPARSAFLTSLASGWTPLLGWLLLATPVRFLSLIGIGVALAGTAFMAGKNWQFGTGEWLTFASSWLFAGQILLVDRLGRLVRANYLTVGFFGSVAVMTILGAIPLACATGLSNNLTWLGKMLSNQDILLTLIGLAVLPTMLSFHLMNIYQPRVPAYRAALIYLLEPVFGAFFSVCVGYDSVTLSLLLGGGLILVGNLLVELPAMLRDEKGPV